MTPTRMTDLAKSRPQAILSLKKQIEKNEKEMKDLLKKETIEHIKANTFTKALVVSFKCGHAHGDNNRTDLMQDSDGNWSFMYYGQEISKKFDDQLLDTEPSVSKILFLSGNRRFLKPMLDQIGLYKESESLDLDNYVRVGIIRKVELIEERKSNKKPLFKLTVSVNRVSKQPLTDYYACLIATDGAHLKMRAFLEYGYEPVSQISQGFVNCNCIKY